MVRDWEAQFRTWAKPPGQTEKERCDNAVSMIRDAIRDSNTLCDRDIAIFAQGSYRNNTNVRRDSDVDVCVCCKEHFFSDFSMADGFTRENVGLTDSDYTYGQFKTEVEQALITKFGSAGVSRGDKAFDVHANTYRVDADVVPCFEHRRYTKRLGNSFFYYDAGTQLQSNSGVRIVNWPQQHYDNGCKKNSDTGTRYKSVVRVLKALSNEMAEQGVQDGAIPSFLIECLVWNVPNDRFENLTYVSDVKAALVYVFEQTKTDDTCNEWGEVNELKYLFRNSQKWTREQANAFTKAAWNYAELKGQS